MNKCWLDYEFWEGHVYGGKLHAVDPYPTKHDPRSKVAEIGQAQETTK